MNKYIYSICTQEDWPELKSVSANSLIEAEEKIMNEHNYYDGDFNDFAEYLNERYNIVISDLYDIETF